MPAKIEVTVKFSELPTPITTTPQAITIQLTDGTVTVQTALRPKNWKKLTDAATQFPMWVAALTGKPGKLTANSIELTEANIQIFEKKPKEPTGDKPSA